MGDEGSAELAVAGSEVQRGLGDAGLVQQAHGERGDQRGLRRRLGDDAVAGDQRRGDLADEDREREVPGRDADEGPTAAQDQAVVLAGRAGKSGRHGELGLGFGSVVAQEVDGFAEFGDGVVQRLAGLGLEQRQDRAAARFHQVGGLAQRGGAVAGGRRVPGVEAGLGGGHRLLGAGGIALGDAADRLAVDRREHVAGGTGPGLAVDQRHRLGHGLGGSGADLGEEAGEALGIAELDAGGVAARRSEEIGRQRDAAMAGCARRPDDVGRRHQQRRDRHVGIAGDRDEGGVGAVLEQAADEIGEKVLMAADRRIGAAGEAGIRLQQALIQGLTHAVQALELEILGVAGELGDGRDSQRVMGGELGNDPRAQGEELLRAGLIIQVGHRLAGEDRIVGQPALLGALQFGVPIGALDQANHQSAVISLGQRRDVVDHRAGALLIGLDGEAETVPAGEGRLRHHSGDDVERKLEPVGLLGVDGEVEVVFFGLAGELDHLWRELGEDALAIGRLVARMQGRELDRDSRAVRQPVVAGGAADGVDRLGVGGVVAVGIGLRAGAFAEHVEGVAVELARAGAGALQCLLDRLAEDEMIAHDAHGLARRGAYGGQAEALGQVADNAGRGLARLDDAGGDAERPGRGRDQEGVGLGFVMGEVALAELVLDQPVGGGGVGHAQQRLGQHHQRKAFLGR